MPSKKTIAASKSRKAFGSGKRRGIWNNKAVILVGIFIFAAIGTLSLRSLFAATTPLTFSIYATHPYASRAGYANGPNCAQAFCPVGQTITDMQVTDDGKLIAGYGDWGADIDSSGVAEGRVGIVPLDLSTNTWGSMTYAGSESLDTIRKINGKVYAPTTDPSIYGSSGFLTNESGTWQLKNDNQGIEHVFDVATLNGTDRWEMGAAGGGAAAYRSVNNDGAWQNTASKPGDWARWYWTGDIGGKLYMGSLGGNTTYGTAGTLVFDGTSWKNLNIQPCGTFEAKQVVSFANKILCPTPNNTYYTTIFDGAKTTSTVIGGGSVRDFYVDGSILYVLSTNGGVYKLTSASGSGTLVAQADYTANSVAVYDGYIYLGYPNGKIYRSNGPLSSTATTTSTNTMTATATNPSSIELDGTSKSITIEGSGFPAKPSIKIGSTSAVVLSGTGSQLQISVSTASIIKKERLRQTTIRSLPVTISSSGYTTINAPPLTVSYTK